MVALTVTVFTASLLGSPHCAGMCGAFAAFALNGGERVELRRPGRAGRGAGPTGPVGPAGRDACPTGPVGLAGRDACPTGPATPAWLLHTMYNGGRLITYVALGAVAGAFGAALDLGGGLIGVQRVATVAAGGMMVAFGIAALASALGVRLPPAPLPEGLRRWVVRGHTRAISLTPLARAGVIGLLTTLLPCGWLYAFAITAAGTGSPLWGAATMAAFWAGTLPVLLAIGAGVRRISGWMGPRLAVVTSLAIVGVGLYTLAGRALVDPAAVARAAEAIAQADGDAAAAPLPCCHGGDTEGGP